MKIWKRIKEVLALATVASFMLPGPVVQTAKAESAKPNIMLIMLDDLDEATFEAFLKTPYSKNIRTHLLNAGTRFTNSFTSDPICCPSRATELTGQYTHNHGVLTVAGGISYAIENGMEQSTRSTWLQSAGYYTGHVGKYLNGYGYKIEGSYIPVGYNKWYGLIDPTTYYVYNFYMNENGVTKFYPQKESNYQTDVLRDKAIEFLNAHQQEGANKPFFLSLTPLAPHIEMTPKSVLLNTVIGYKSHWQETIRPAIRHLHLADGIKTQWNDELPNPVRKPSFGVKDKGKIAFYEEYIQEELSSLDERAINQQYKERMASLVAVDEMIGKVVEKLGSKINNTYIFFTSDNGYFHGEHNLSSKVWPYEEAIRVPLIVRGPGVAAGATSKALVMNNDLAPTYAQLGGAVPTHSVDGRSLVPLLQNPNASWDRKNVMVQLYRESSKEFFGFENSEIWVDLSVPAYKAIRCETSTVSDIFIRWYENTETANISDPKNLGPVTSTEYYDMKTDKYQMKNSISTLNGARKSEVETLLNKMSACKGADCVNAENGL